MATAPRSSPMQVGWLQKLLGALALLLAAMLVVAIARRAGGAGLPVAHMPWWLIVHMLTVIPALPLGAYLLLRPKGTPRHRLLGKIWCALMVVTAVVSFGTLLPGAGAYLSWLHIFSIATLAGVPRLIMAARRHDLPAHRRGVTMVYGGLVGAGLFVFLPWRVLGSWLLG